MTRLEHLLKYIDKNDSIIDVGCENAYFGIMLANKGIKSIASDIKTDRAIKIINQLKLNDYIDIRQGNGLETIKETDHINTVVMSGMGTHLILNILSKTNIKFDKIITISNTKHSMLRKEMNKLNYKIFAEEIIIEKSKYYNIIVFKYGKEKLTYSEELIGKNHKNKKLFKEYYSLKLKILNNLLEKVPSNQDIKKQIKIISESL